MTTRAHRRDEAGFTVVEVAVAVLLLGIVGTVLFNFLDSATTATGRATRHIQAEQEVTLALRSLTQDVRSADKIAPCTSGDYRTCITIDIPRYAGVGATCPSRVVTYALVGTTIQQTELVYPASCGTPTTRYSGRVVLSNVTNGATALFSYFDRTGKPIDAVANAATLPTTAGSVKTSVVVGYGISSAPKITLSSTAALRNKR